MQAVQQLQQMIIATRGEAGPWASQLALKEFLLDSRSRYTDREYHDHLVELEYEDGVLQLGNAFEYVHRRLALAPSTIAVLADIASFWKGWHASLRADALVGALRASWVETVMMFDPTVVVCSTFVDKSANGLLIDGEPALDLSLDLLVDPRVGPNEDDFKAVFNSWLGADNGPAHAASLVDFALRVRMTKSARKIYSNSLVRTIAFSSSIWSDSLEKATPYFTQFYGDPLMELLKGEAPVK